MPAFPFQSFPTLEEYCQWLAGKGGSVEEGENEWGRFTRMISPDGESRVIEAGTEQAEVLAPSSVVRLDCRLGLVSPWKPSFDDNDA